MGRMRYLLRRKQKKPGVCQAFRSPAGTNLEPVYGGFEVIGRIGSLISICRLLLIQYEYHLFFLSLVLKLQCSFSSQDIHLQSAFSKHPKSKSLLTFWKSKTAFDAFLRLLKLTTMVSHRAGRRAEARPQQVACRGQVGGGRNSNACYPSIKTEFRAEDGF